MANSMNQHSVKRVDSLSLRPSLLHTSLTSKTELQLQHLQAIEQVATVIWQRPRRKPLPTP